MADIQYLNYGDLQIELLALLNTLANLVLNYVAGQPWSAKRKEKFMSAYADIMNRGILGANSNTGAWQIKIGGTPIEYLSNKDKEMYEEAAYFIQQLMDKLSKSSTVKEEEKSDLPIFSNELFLSDITKSINNDKFGGLSEGFKTSDWNEFDKRDSTGKRGRTERASILASQLEKYRDSLSEEKYNFKDSSFGSLEEFKTRLNSAIAALNSPDEADDKEALLRIGIRESDWFNNGLGDSSGKTFKLEDGTEWSPTYGDLIEYNQKLEKLKLAEKVAAEKALVANRFAGTRRYNISGYNGTPIADQKSMDSLTSKLSTFLKLSTDDLSKLTWAFKHSGANLEDLSREEFLKMPAQYRKAGRLKKISELPGIYYDTIGGGLVLPYNNDLTQSSLSDIIIKNNPEFIQQQQEAKNKQLRDLYSKRTKMTGLDWEYLGSIIPDIASIVDVEPWSAGALALSGAGIRHHALANRPGGMSTSDKWWQALDYAGGAFAAIPGFGDAYLVGRALNTIKRVSTGLLAVAGTYGMATSGYRALKKLTKGESLSTLEKMDLLSSIPALVSAYRLRSKSGLDEAAKAANQTTVSTEKGKVKVTITDASGNKSTKEITGLSKEKTLNLAKQFQEAGNDNAKKAQILQSDADILALAKKLKIDLNLVSIETPTRRLATHRKPTEIEIYPETTPSSARARYDAEIDRLQSGNWWDRLKARDLRFRSAFYRTTGGPEGTSNFNFLGKIWHGIVDTKNLDFARIIKEGNPSTNTSNTTNNSPTITSPTITSTGSNAKPKSSSLTKVESLELLSTMRGKNFSTNTPMLELAVSVKGFGDIYFLDAKNGKLTLTFELPEGLRFEATSSVGDKKENLKLLQKTMKNIDSNLPKKQKSRIKLEVIRRLKAIGALKQGGKITDSQIDNFLKQYK